MLETDNKTYNQTFKHKIDLNNKLLSNKLQEIEDLTYEVNLIKENQVATLKQFSSPIHFIDLDQICADFNQEKHKFKKEGKKSKEWMEFIEKNYFFKNDYNVTLQYIVRSCDANYQTEGYEFIYKSDKGFGFTISVPLFENTTVNNYTNMRFRIYEHVTDSYLNCVYSTLFIEDLMEQVDLFIMEKGAGVNG